MHKKNLTIRLSLLFILLLGILGTKSLLKPEFYTNHDGEHQLVRQYIFDRAVKAGHFPPKVDRQLLNGLGYPLFTFTYQLPFWIGELFVLSGLSFALSIKAVFILTFILSGAAMYLFARDKWGQSAGLLAAFLYMWAPYRFLTILVRASLGEHVALVFIPLLFWSLGQVSKKRKIWGGIAIAGLFLSHGMVTQMVILPLLLYWLAQFLSQPKKSTFILHSALIAFVGLGLSAFYWFPALYYQSQIQGLNATFYAEHFVTLKQLIYSKWGYAFSVLGEADGLSFQIGIAQWLVVSAALLLVFKSKAKKTALSLIAAFTLSVFLMTQLSTAIWEKAVSWGVVIDIPWRFLSIATFTSSALAGFVVKALPGHFKRILILSLVAVALYTNRNHLRINEARSFDPTWFSQFGGTSNSYNEYQSTRTSEELLKTKNLAAFDVTNGNIEVEILKDGPQELVLKTEVKETDSVIRINTTYFPGWRLYLNQQEQIIKRDYPEVHLGPGSYQIDLVYRQTQLMRLANLVSLATGGIVIFVVLKQKYGLIQKA